MMRNYQKQWLNSVSALALLPVLAAAVLVVLLILKAGASFTTDSFGYLTISRHLVEDASFTDYLGVPVTVWPPLLPLFLALLRLVGLSEPDQLAAVLNSISYIVSAGLGSWLLWNALQEEDRVHASWMSIPLLLLSSPLVVISLWFLSEPLFIAFTILFFTVALRFSAKGANSVPLMGITAAAAMMTRYAGISLLVTGVILLLLFEETLRSRIRKVLIFSVTAVLPLILWVLRNYMVSATLTGPRLPSHYSIDAAIADLLHFVLRWFLPGRIAADPIPVLLISLVFIAGWIRIVRDSRFRTHPSAKLALILVIFSFVYTFFMIISTVTVSMDHIVPRLLAPLAIPAALMYMMWLYWTVKLFPFQRAFGITVLLLLLVAASIIPASRLLALKDYRAEGWSAVEWRENRLIPEAKAIMLQSPDAFLLSNLPIMISWYGGLQAERSLLDEGSPAWDPAKFRKQREKLNRCFREKQPVYLAWFDWGGFGIAMPLTELQQYYRLDTVLSIPEGYIFAVSARPADTAVPASQESEPVP
ncbi:hypothetical protein KQI65_00180 [bacterium]|nr:hypothetical protein [bacterium]